MELEVGSATMCGPRPENQDRSLVLSEAGFFAVADGIGGEPGGATASRLAIEAVQRFYARSAPGRDLTHESGRMDLAFRMAKREVVAASTGVRARMGTTLVAVRVLGDRAVIGHVGDSRLYRLRAGALEQMTRDHTLRNHWIRAVGTDERALSDGLADMLTRAIAARCDSQADLLPTDVRPGDVFLLCSDGVCKPLGKPRLTRLLHGDANSAAWRLARTALRAGGRDNATAVVVRVTG